MTVFRENGHENFQGSEPTEKFIKIIDDGIQAMSSHDANNALYYKDTCEQKQVMTNICSIVLRLHDFNHKIRLIFSY